MTAVELLGLIAVALLLQLTVGIGVSLRRRRVASAAVAAAATTVGDAPADRAWAAWRAFRVSRREFEDAERSQCSFCLEPVDGEPLPAFRPGQFLTFNLDVATPQGPRAITRCYSLSDRPDPSHYRVTIKRVPAPHARPEVEPGLASNHFHDNVQVGDILRLKAPGGHFFIDPDPTVPVVLIAGGIGITPMMSMLRWSLGQHPQRTVHLFYGLRHGREQAFKAQLETMAASHPALHLNIVYSRPAQTDVLGRDFQHPGHVTVELLRRTLPQGRHRFYVCGPPR
jgi:ferredoxin-NADP reductase